MKFTADEAIELQGTEDAIILNEAAARKICLQHSTSLDEWLSQGGELTDIDAGRLFAWLGY